MNINLKYSTLPKEKIIFNVHKLCIIDEDDDQEIGYKIIYKIFYTNSVMYTILWYNDTQWYWERKGRPFILAIVYCVVLRKHRKMWSVIHKSFQYNFHLRFNCCLVMPYALDDIEMYVPPLGILFCVCVNIRKRITAMGFWF